MAGSEAGKFSSFIPRLRAPWPRDVQDVHSSDRRRRPSPCGSGCTSHEHCRRLGTCCVPRTPAFDIEDPVPLLDISKVRGSEVLDVDHVSASHRLRWYQDCVGHFALAAVPSKGQWLALEQRSKWSTSFLKGSSLTHVANCT